MNIFSKHKNVYRHLRTMERIRIVQHRNERSEFCNDDSCIDPPLLTYCILVDSSTIICWTSLSVNLGVSRSFCRFYSIFDGKFWLQAT